MKIQHILNVIEFFGKLISTFIFFMSIIFLSFLVIVPEARGISKNVLLNCIYVFHVALLISSGFNIYRPRKITIFIEAAILIISSSSFMIYSSAMESIADTLNLNADNASPVEFLMIINPLDYLRINIISIIETSFVIISIYTIRFIRYKGKDIKINYL
ncbi:MAG: hypothetical protein CDV28_13526 [Candidatus Electronema aureum]|uniref:Uncharacterized protein n=1 Tax=Candidatus Electronema aureum TaxID=2005002 RepID=A0A521FZM3_9BACT|nr:MAG: hypothetical protein CDV28_13526 [Candidatus Electronema aureum]